MSIGSPRVSAVITTYNVADDIPGLRERVGPMPVVDEIVIHDDGSSDSTPALLKDWAASDPRVSLFLSPHNQGVAAARNQALARCHGEFVWFADPDDEWSPELVQVLYEAVTETGSDIAVGRAVQRAADRHEAYVIDGLDHRAIRDRAATIELVLSGAVRGYLWNKLLRRSVLPPAAFPAMRSQSDFVGVIQAIRRSTNTVFVPQVIYTRVERAGSITRKAADQVENLRRCVATVQTILAEEGRAEQYSDAFQYFRMWFFAIPAANTPLRTGADAQLVRSGIRAALDVLTQVPIRVHLRTGWSAPRLEFQVVCLLLLRNSYPSAYRAAKALKSRFRDRRR